MKRTLERVVRVRALLESLTLGEFERKNAELRVLETSAGEQRRLGDRTRAGVVQQLAGESRPSWRVDLADSEILRRKQERLEILGERAKPAVGQAREELLRRRVDRRQAEVLVSNAAHAEQREQVRREQNRLDDWFQSRRARRNRRPG